MMLDYEILRLIWWALLGILIIGFTILDGFVLGSGMLIPFAGKTDEERRFIINAVGPVWESNQVWLIIAGGASFAAWPFVYSVSFSGLYFGFILALFAIIIRPVAYKFRSKNESQRWRNTWDWSLAIGGLVAPLIFGVAFGNLFLGLPFYFDADMRMHYEGTFFQLLTPFPLFCGIMAIAMMMMQGAAYLNIKTEGALQERLQSVGRKSSLVVAIMFTFGSLIVLYGIKGYDIISPIVTSQPSSPLLKEVVRSGTWMGNFYTYPVLFTIPLFGMLALVLAYTSFKAGSKYIPFIATSLTQASILATTGISLFPYLIPSSLNPSHSLTVWDSSSSHMTLFIMLLAVVIFLPIVAIYVSWAYKVMGGKVNAKTLKQEKTNAY